MSRRLFFLLALSWSSGASLLAQQGNGLLQVPEGFVRPQAIVEIREVSEGTQELTVSFVAPGYAKSSIARHLAAWRALSGRPILSSSVGERKVPMPDGKTMVITRWVLQTRGIVDWKTGGLDIQAVARALAELKDLDVLWLVPSFPYRGFGTFKSPAAAMTAVATPENVHMFVHVSATDPKEIVIPSVYTPPPAEPAKPVRQPRPLGMLIFAAIGASVLVGVLVYFILRLSVGPVAR